MYDEIKRRFEQRLSEGPRFTVERIRTVDDYAEADTSRMTSHVTAALERRNREMFDEVDATEAAAANLDAVSDFGGLLTQRQLVKHFAESVSVELSIPRKYAFEFTVPSGLQHFAPPYDLDWAVGNGVAAFSRFDGKAYVIPKDNAFSAAGLGFYLTTDQPALVSVTPEGDYNFSWSSFKDLPFARSSGGMGITVYKDVEPKPTHSNQPVLWSVSGMKMLEGGKGSGRIADAASPAFGFGTVPLAPVLFNMEPESRYLVWVWGWQSSQVQDNSGFFAYLGFHMPIVTINAGPQIIIH